jgi:hypothetical protein
VDRLRGDWQQKAQTARTSHMVTDSGPNALAVVVVVSPSSTGVWTVAASVMQ